MSTEEIIKKLYLCIVDSEQIVMIIMIRPIEKIPQNTRHATEAAVVGCAVVPMQDEVEDVHGKVGGEAEGLQ